MREDEIWQVVADREGRHSVWPCARHVPTGWVPVGFTGTREACIAHVDATWADLAPASLRRALADRRERGAHA